MTVLELKQAINHLPDDMPVIMQKDSDGNGYSPCSGASHTEGLYFPENNYSGDFYTEGDIGCLGLSQKDGVQVLLLWPIQ